MHHMLLQNRTPPTSEATAVRCAKADVTAGKVSEALTHSLGQGDAVAAETDQVGC